MTTRDFVARNAAIPSSLRNLHQWARWMKGSRDKMPANLDNSAMKWGTSANWLTFEQIADVAQIGIILVRENGIVPVDIDGCRNKETGEIHPLVQRWLDEAHTYAEISPSGTGIKFYLCGSLPAGIKEIKATDVPWRTSPDQEHVGIELYASRHFFTITGNIVPGCPSSINEAPVVLNELLVRFAPLPKVRNQPKGPEPSRIGTWDFDAWVRRYCDIIEVLPDGYIIRCPWEQEHSTPGDTARLWEGPPHTFHCFHAHCASRIWRDVRLAFEPDAPPMREMPYSPAESGTAGNSNGHHPPEDTSDRAVDLCHFSADDAGNGDAMQALYGQDFLYCGARGWFSNTGTHWELDADGAKVRQSAVATLRQRRHAAVDAGSESIIKCTKGDESRVNGCVSRFKTLVYISIDEFDNNPDLLNCKNGVVDLRTGTIEPHSRAQRFTYSLPVEYGPADYSVWVEYLNGVVCGGQEVIDYLQMAVGYSFTGHTREEILFYLYGPTRSGKGTFAETLMALLPSPLSTMVDFNSFTAKRDGDVSNFDLAPLKPSRLIFASESNRNQSLNPAKIKQLTGGDPVRACFKHRDFFTYRPQFQVWMMSNWPVNGDPEDDALWGRVRVIEFPNSFLGKEDKSKKARLKEPDVLKGILYWTVQGAIKWYALGAKGLLAPDPVVKRTQAQRAELDYVQQWLAECCEDNEGGWTANEDVNASYTEWCKNNNVQYPKSPKGLAQCLKAKGYEPGEVRNRKGEDGKVKSKRGVGGLYVYPDTIKKWERNDRWTYYTC